MIVSQEVTIKILIKGADWSTVRSILRKEDQERPFDQLMNSRKFGGLKSLGLGLEDNDLVFSYCRLFTEISKGFDIRKKAELIYTQVSMVFTGGC